MDNSIHKHFNFFILEVEAEVMETEAEQIKAFLGQACSYLDSRQKGSIERAITPTLNKLHRAAEASRAEANRRKANIANAEDPEIKRILELFYIEGRTLERMADILYCDRTTISRKVKRYCKQYLEKG